MLNPKLKLTGFILCFILLQGCVQSIQTATKRISLATTSDANIDQVAELDSAFGIDSQEKINGALAEMRASGYGSSSEISTLIQYLRDKRTAASREGETAVTVRDARYVRDRRKQAAYERTYPYKVVLKCGYNGEHVNIMACFVGGRYSPDTQVEFGSSPTNTRLYQGWELSQIGNEYQTGFVFDAKAPIYIKAQNSSENLILSLELYDRRSGRWIYKKDAARFGVVGFRD